MKDSPRSTFSYFAFPLFIALLLGAVFVFRESLLSVFRDREAIRLWIRESGQWGWAAFMALQMFQVVVFIIPGELVQIAGGYIFGLWGGTALSLAGITLGSLFNFAIGRLLGRPFVEALFKKDKLEAIERVTASGKAAAGFFLLFVIPGIPKDALCYLAGVSKLSWPVFFGISMIGRMPGILGSSYMGAAAFGGDYRAALLVLAIASLLFFSGLIFKEKIEIALMRILRRGKK